MSEGQFQTLKKCKSRTKKTTSANVLTINDIPTPGAPPVIVSEPTAVDAWRAVRTIFHSIDIWREWLAELRESGDADPCIPDQLLSQCDELSTQLHDRQSTTQELLTATIHHLINMERESIA